MKNLRETGFNSRHLLIVADEIQCTVNMLEEIIKNFSISKDYKIFIGSNFS